MKPKQYAEPKKCDGKNCYRNKSEAEKVAWEQESFDLSGETKISVYRCAFCGFWHLTSKKTLMLD